MELIKIRLRELREFCQSNRFKQFRVKPISPLRVKSYLNNPHADSDDFVLYLLVEGENLIAFRTVLSDSLIDEGKIIKFGWYSGSWVDPKFRRKGLSKQLLKEVYNDWNQQMMLTNYSEVSRILFENAHLLSLFRKRQGFRFYLFPDFKSILKGRKYYPVLRFICPLLTLITAGYVHLKSVFRDKNSNCSFIETTGIDNECRQYLEQSPSNHFFRRNTSELQWILQYPWITDKNEQFNYPFSYDNINFLFQVVKWKPQNEMKGFFIYSILNRKMKILYYFMEKENITDLIDQISVIAWKHKVQFLTILEPQLAQSVRQKSRIFAFHKKFESHLYSSFKTTKNDQIVFDGDGDNCFT